MSKRIKRIAQWQFYEISSPSKISLIAEVLTTIDKLARIYPWPNSSQSSFYLFLLSFILTLTGLERMFKTSVLISVLSNMSKNDSTKSRILDAAEQLFAERGFAETSLRTITARAKVNLASVNYHFGSKKSLIQDVFDRFLSDYTSGLTTELNKMELVPSNSISTETLLKALVSPLMLLDERRDNSIAIFMRLLGRAYAETQGHLRRYVTEKYGFVLVRFTRLFQSAYPNLSNDQIFWRLHYTLGSLIFTLAGSEALREISAADFKRDLKIEDVIDEIIPFLAAGMKA